MLRVTLFEFRAFHFGKCLQHMSQWIKDCFCSIISVYIFVKQQPLPCNSFSLFGGSFCKLKMPLTGESFPLTRALAGPMSLLIVPVDQTLFYLYSVQLWATGDQQKCCFGCIFCNCLNIFVTQKPSSNDGTVTNSYYNHINTNYGKTRYKYQNISNAILRQSKI